MSIAIIHQHGVGVNSHYHILRDGVHVAHLERHGMTACRIASVHYYEELGQYRNVARAKEVAQTIHFPSAREVYETICKRRETARRSWKEKAMQPEIMQLVYALASGSNSAQARLIEIAAEIDTFALDRTATGARAEAERKAYNDALSPEARRDSVRYAYSSDAPVYPEPPQDKAA